VPGDVPLISYRKVTASSERSFGITFAVVFTLVGLWPLIRHDDPRWWAFAVALGFLAAAFLAPGTLGSLNRLWRAIGLIVHRTTNAIIMVFLFFLVIFPIGIILRISGRDLLRLKNDPKADSYWISRALPGPAPGSMSKQY
jgi:hypothetical protein